MRHAPKKSIYLTDKNRTDLLLVPRMQLHLLIDGRVEAEYFTTLIGVFNIAIAINQRFRRRDSTDLEQGQTLAAKLFVDLKPPNKDQSAILLTAFNKADLLIRTQKKTDLARAVSYVDRTISEGRATSIADMAKTTD